MNLRLILVGQSGPASGRNAAGKVPFGLFQIIGWEPLSCRLSPQSRPGLWPRPQFPEFLAQFDIQAPIRVPISFSTDPDKSYHIPCIEMHLEVQAALDYEGKIDRSPRNMDWPIAQGESAAETFLRERAAAVATK
jgi:hypothetical protein